MRRVLTVSFGYPSDQAPARMLFTHEQARALLRAGAEVAALDLAPPDEAPGSETREGIAVTRVRLPRSFRSRPLHVAARLFEVRRAIARHASRGAFDLVLLSFLEHKYASLWGAFRSGGGQIAFTAHGVDAMARYEAPTVRAIKTGLLMAADHVFAVSEATAELVRDLLPLAPDRAKVRVIENGVDRAKLDRARHLDRELIRTEMGWPLERPVVLSVGHLVPRKGLDRLIDAVGRLRQRGLDPFYVIVGRGPEAEALRARVGRRGLESSVRFEERVLSDDELARAMAACDVFALASRTLLHPPAMEGFGVVYAEASYLGRPVVAGASGGVSTVVVDEVTGLMVDPEGADAGERFADAIGRLLSDRELAARLGEHGHRRARERFDWDLNARRVLEATEIEPKVGGDPP